MVGDLLFMILRGIIIGVVVSAPMGPVGIFCIQRTLDKGRLCGLYTGIGAAVSDLIYCLLTGFGLSFIEEFINTHRAPIQLLGSVVLIFFGIWLVRKKPDGAIPDDSSHDSLSPKGDILKGFALTFSNPLILFLIIGLFAQFNFVIEGMKFYHYILGFIGIIAGALGWWWLVTYFVDKLRSHFNMRTMKLINTIIGIIILIFAAVGIFTSVGSMASAAGLPQMQPHQESVSVSFRVADTAMKGWHAEIRDSAGYGFRLLVSPSKVADAFGDTERDALSVTVLSLYDGHVVAESLITEGVDPYRGPNAWKLSRGESGGWLLFGGNREYRHVLSFPSQGEAGGFPEIAAADGGQIKVSDWSVAADAIIPSVIVDPDAVCLHSGAKRSEVAGIYSLYDYEHDDSYASLGGAYRIGVIPVDEDSGFDIVYLDGARICAPRWLPGMRKGRLIATPFANVYDAEWTDAEGRVMRRDIQADFEPLTGLLTIRFPYQSSVLRFRKE